MIFFPLSAKLIAGAVWHDDVQQNQIRRILPHPRLRLAGTVCGNYIVTLPGEQLPHQQRVVLIIVDDEDSR
jgi:hypothetical protein